MTTTPVEGRPGHAKAGQKRGDAVHIRGVGGTARGSREPVGKTGEKGSWITGARREVNTTRTRGVSQEAYRMGELGPDDGATTPTNGPKMGNKTPSNAPGAAFHLEESGKVGEG